MVIVLAASQGNEKDDDNVDHDHCSGCSGWSCGDDDDDDVADYRMIGL